MQTRATVLEAIASRTLEVCERLGACSEHELLALSLLPAWSRLTIACHLRYGASAFSSMTESTLRGEDASYYPGGRSAKRPGTLEPHQDERPIEVVSSLRSASAELQATWEAVDDAAWALDVVEPAGNPDLGPMKLDHLPILRLTEVEVHGTDLGLDLSGWSDVFVEVTVPVRLERLAQRTPADPMTESTWFFDVADGPSIVVAARGAAVHVDETETPSPTAQRIDTTRRGLLAILLGRAVDGEAARSFSATFPGP